MHLSGDFKGYSSVYDPVFGSDSEPESCFHYFKQGKLILIKGCLTSASVGKGQLVIETGNL